VLQNYPYLCLCYFGFQHIIIHVLHLFMGRNQSPSEFSVPTQIFFYVEFRKADVVASVPPSSPTSSVAKTIYQMHVSTFFIFKRVGHFAYDCTAKQRSHTSLDNVQAGTQLSYTCSTSLH
jgi:hypothetical protein